MIDLEGYTKAATDASISLGVAVVIATFEKLADEHGLDKSLTLGEVIEMLEDGV